MHHIDFKDKKVLIRVDFNVPLNGSNEITDDTRIRKAIPTLNYILDKGASLIIMSHLGRPQKKRLEDGSINREKFTLNHLTNHISKLLNREVKFCHSTIGGEAKMMSDRLTAGDVLLLENTRFHEEEAQSDPEFSAMLRALGDVYVNDAFGTAHRDHASTAGVARYFKPEEKGFGLLMKTEIDNADKVLKSPRRPFTAIIGGAKVSDKIKLLDRLIELANHIIIGGGMAYTFIKAQGGKVGDSLCENDYLDLANELLDKAKAEDVEIHLPTDSIVADKFDAQANSKVSESNEIEEGWMGLDIGPKAIAEFDQVLKASKTILWNGPLGVFEMEKFSEGTLATAHHVASATMEGAYSLIGGGDSVSAINKAGQTDEVSFVSTGGGALLTYLEGKTLPGIKAILS